MDHHIDIIQCDPLALGGAGDPVALDAFLLETLFHRVGEGFDVRSTRSRYENVVIGNAGKAPYIKDYDVFSLFIQQRLSGFGGNINRFDVYVS